MIEFLMGTCCGIGSTLVAMCMVDDYREKKYLREHNVDEEYIEVI